jgi:hypothetical protein
VAQRDHTPLKPPSKCERCAEPMPFIASISGGLDLFQCLKCQKAALVPAAGSVLYG